MLAIHEQHIIRNTEKGTIEIRYYLLNTENNKYLDIRTTFYKNHKPTSYVYDFKKGFKNNEIEDFLGCSIANWTPLINKYIEKTPKELFYEILEEIRENYPTYNFIVERDLVWTIQKLLMGKFKDLNLDYEVFNDYPIERGSNRALSVDLAILKSNISYKDILDAKAQAELVIEFKFEPSQKRKEILAHKCPVVSWNKVTHDIDRISRFVNDNKAKTGIAVFIDEYGLHLKDSNSYPNIANWHNWGTYSTSDLDIKLLLSEVRNFSLK